MSHEAESVLARRALAVLDHPTTARGRPWHGLSGRAQNALAGGNIETLQALVSFLEANREAWALCRFKGLGRATCIEIREWLREVATRDGIRY